MSEIKVRKVFRPDCGPCAAAEHNDHAVWSNGTPQTGTQYGYVKQGKWSYYQFEYLLYTDAENIFATYKHSTHPYPGTFSLYRLKYEGEEWKYEMINRFYTNDPEIPAVWLLSPQVSFLISMSFHSREVCTELNRMLTNMDINLPIRCGKYVEAADVWGNRFCVLSRGHEGECKVE